MLLSCGAEGSIAVRLLGRTLGCDGEVCELMQNTSNRPDDSSASSGSEKGHGNGASVLFVSPQAGTNTPPC